MQRNPSHTNPLEQQQLEWLQSNYGSNPQAAGMFFGILDDAGNRFEQRRDTRQEGLGGLREMAMQLASQGASQDALTGALTGQAEALPLMGGAGGDRRVGALSDFVDSLYGSEPVSGLAPADYRAQFDTGGTGYDDADRQQVAALVSQQSAAGQSFREIREGIRRQFLALGYDDLSINQATTEAESIYERLIGGSLEDMRALGAGLRSELGGNQIGEGFTNEALHDVTGMPSATFGEDPGTGVEGFLAQVVNNPQLYHQLQQWFATQGQQQQLSQASPAPSGFGGLPANPYDRR